MYPALLGRFVAPQPGHWTKSPHWVENVQYQPEPPLAVRGAMNPWEQERQRVVFAAEELTWVKIQAQQKEYRRVLRLIDVAIDRYNQLIHELEELTGKKSGAADIANYAMLAYSLSGGPYGFVLSIAKMGFDFLMSSKKKKKINKKIHEIESVQAELKRLSQVLDGIQKKVHDLILTGDKIRDTQAVQMSKDVEVSEQAWAKRQSLDKQRADVLRERNRQVALWQPRPRGGIPDAL